MWDQNIGEWIDEGIANRRAARERRANNTLPQDHRAAVSGFMANRHYSYPPNASPEASGLGNDVRGRSGTWHTAQTSVQYQNTSGMPQYASPEASRADQTADKHSERVQEFTGNQSPSNPQTSQDMVIRARSHAKESVSERDVERDHGREQQHDKAQARERQVEHER